MALAVADLLVEKGEILEQETLSKSQKSYAQALLLYKRSLQDTASAVPVDIEQNIEHLEKTLRQTHWPDDINRILTLES